MKDEAVQKAIEQEFALQARRGQGLDHKTGLRPGLVPELSAEDEAFYDRVAQQQGWEDAEGQTRPSLAAADPGWAAFEKRLAVDLRKRNPHLEIDDHGNILGKKSPIERMSDDQLYEHVAKQQGWTD